MKAVNLIPSDLRRSGSPGGRSDGLVYALLGGLALLVVLAAAWAVAGKQTASQKNEAARLSAQAVELERQAGALARYEAAAAASKSRADTIRGIAFSRFQWAHAFREVSRVLPKEAWLTSMIGTVAPGVTVEGGSANPLRGAINQPALEIVGCSRDQDSVARIMASLRVMQDVTRVTLASSAKNDNLAAGGNGATSSGSSSSSEDCRAGSSTVPQFNLVVFFKSSGQQPVSATGAAAAAPASPAAAGKTANSSSSTASTGASK